MIELLCDRVALRNLRGTGLARTRRATAVDKLALATRVIVSINEVMRAAVAGPVRPIVTMATPLCVPCPRSFGSRGRAC